MKEGASASPDGNSEVLVCASPDEVEGWVEKGGGRKRQQTNLKINLQIEQQNLSGSPTADRKM